MLMQVQVLTCASHPLAIYLRFPHPPNLGSVNLLEQLTGLGEIRTSFTSVLQDTIKDPDEQPMKSYTE